MNEIERRLATRICAVLPAEESFHDGEGIFPVLGDTLFEDNFTDSPLPMGTMRWTEGSMLELRGRNNQL